MVSIPTLTQTQVWGRGLRAVFWYSFLNFCCFSAGNGKIAGYTFSPADFASTKSAGVCRWKGTDFILGFCLVFKKLGA